MEAGAIASTLSIPAKSAKAAVQEVDAITTCVFSSNFEVDLFSFLPLANSVIDNVNAINIDVNYYVFFSYKLFYKTMHTMQN